MRRLSVMLIAIFIISISLFSSLVFASKPPLSGQAFVNRPDVKHFIDFMVKKYHFNEKTLTDLFAQVKLRPQVIQHMKAPLEQRASWHTYQMLFVDEWRIQRGVRFWDTYADILTKAQMTYGVPASIIVATIGVETRFGSRIGGYRVIDSLSSIAFSDSSRAVFFKSQLTEFLLLCRDQGFDPLKVMGSYAGAMGQPQFMPSSYRYYGVDFSHSGKIDLMNNEADIIGSIANYYHQYGWKMDEPVAIPATIIGERFRFFIRDKKPGEWFTLAQLARYGVLPTVKINNPKLKARVLILPSRYSNEYWIAFHNFYVIKHYNPSDMYAMALYQLSVYIAALRDRLHEK